RPRSTARRRLLTQRSSACGPDSEPPATGVAAGGLANLAELPLHLVDLVAEPGGLLEPQVARGLVHLVGEALNEPAQLIPRQVEPVGLRRARAAAASPPPAACGRVLVVAAGADHLVDVGVL